MRHLRFLVVSSLLWAAGCGEGGPTTKAVCPSPQTLTYANFGSNFMSRYCLRCHSSALTGDVRYGAPADVNFNTADDVRRWSDEIDRQAAAGPAATNTAMPPSDPRPTTAERTQLGEWLACGAPN